MNTVTRTLVALLLLIGLPAFSGCANLTPIENAGAGAGVATPLTYVALHLAGVPDNISVPVSAGVGVGAGLAAYCYSKHQATLLQKKVAEARARHLYANLDDSQKAIVKRIAVVTEKTDATKGVPVMYVDPKSGEAGNTVYDFNKMPNSGKVLKASEVATAFN